MPESIPADSVGLVQPQCEHFDEAIELECGRQLASYDLVYEAYGELNADASNAVLVCHALSGTHHAAGYHDMSGITASAPANRSTPIAFTSFAATTWVAVTARQDP